MVRKGAKTQKRKKTRSTKSMSAMGIPELRKSLDYIGEYTNSLVQSGKTVTREMTIQFAKEWRKVFGKSMSLDSAKEYLESVMKTSKGPKRTKLTRKRQRGGAQDMTLTGAPMNHPTRPGVDIPYGQFLPYVNKGFWNPEQAPAADCGSFKPVLPPAGMGSNSMKGGGLMDVISNSWSAATFRPAVATNPTSPQFDAQTAWKGQELGPGPEAWQQAWKPMTGATSNSIPSAGTYTRDVTADVRTR